MTEGQGSTAEKIIASTKYRLAQLRAQRWLAGLLAAIIIAGIIVGIIFTIRAIRHHGHPAATTTNTTSQRPNFKNNGKSGTNNSRSNNSGNSGATIPGSDNNSTGKSSGSSSSRAAGPSLKSGQQLTNTGPGDVAAIFLSASFLAASLHYLASQRKTAR